MNKPVPSRPYTPPDDPRLPRFSSLEEEAAFWDTHDVFDLSPMRPEELAELEAIDEAKAEALTVHLDRETYEAVVTEARVFGLDPSTLVRAWVHQRLRAVRGSKQA